MMRKLWLFAGIAAGILFGALMALLRDRFASPGSAGGRYVTPILSTEERRRLSTAAQDAQASVARAQDAAVESAEGSKHDATGKPRDVSDRWADIVAFDRNRGK